MVALARKDAGAVEVLTTQLRRLDDAVHADEEPDDYRRTSLAPGRRATAGSPARRPWSSTTTTEDLPEVRQCEDPADAGRRGARTRDRGARRGLQSRRLRWPGAAGPQRPTSR